MRRRGALRPSFVVTFALGTAAIGPGCSSSKSIINPPAPASDGGGDGSIDDGGDGSIDDGGCPAEEPTPNTPCDPPPATPGQCFYPTGMCFGAPTGDTAQCVRGPGPGNTGTWSVSPEACNPPPQVYEAGPDVYDAAPDVYEGGPDGEGHDGGND